MVPPRRRRNVEFAAVNALLSERRHSKVLEAPLAAPRTGIMLHYDDSTRDDWAVAWFSNPRCTNGYSWLVLDDGRVVELADPAMRTPHAGACLTPMANSRFYGISAATNGLVPATEAQMASIVELCAALCRAHGWNDATERIVGHDAQAIWTVEATRAAGMAEAKGRALWGRLGRKVDPTGVRTDGLAVLATSWVRRLVELRLA